MSTFLGFKLPDRRMSQTNVTTVKYNKLFINNEWCDSESGKTFPVINPATEEVICHVAEADGADLDKAVRAARAAYHHDAPWRRMDASQRGRLLYKLADLLERDCDVIGNLMTLEAGKTVEQRRFEVEESLATLRYMAGWADKNHGKVIPADGNIFAYTRHESIGVCGIMAPWNVPLFAVGSSLPAALTTGNVVILKPSQFTPLTALHLVCLTKEAGFPPGVVNVVTGLGSTIGAAISSHPDIDKISYTGSSATGANVRAAAATSNQKLVSCEQGGKSPLVIFDDCPDIEEAAKMAHYGVFYNQGEICIAASRTYVHEDIYDEFVRISHDLVTKIVVGDPRDPTTTQGPQTTEVAMNRILDYIKLGQDEGATLICGGKRIGHKGYYIEPTIFSDVTDNMTIAREEIFGPVMSILKFSSLDEVIERANDTRYGLTAGIYSRDMEKCNKFVQTVRAGSVYVNDYVSASIQCPFGGYKGIWDWHRIRRVRTAGVLTGQVGLCCDFI